MFDSIIRTKAAQYQLPESWVRAVIQVESAGNPQAYRAEPQIKDASYGLMQLLYGTAKGLGYAGAPDGLYDPETNIDLGSKLLAQLRARWGDDFRRVYSAYNSGRPDLWETSTAVAAHVARAVAALESAVAQEPIVAATGSFGVVLVGLLLWFWLKRAKTK